MRRLLALALLTAGCVWHGDPRDDGAPLSQAGSRRGAGDADTSAGDDAGDGAALYALQLARTLADSDAAEACFARQVQRYVQGGEPSACAAERLAESTPRRSGGSVTSASASPTPARAARGRAWR